MKIYLLIVTSCYCGGCTNNYYPHKTLDGAIRQLNRCRQDFYENDHLMEHDDLTIIDEETHFVAYRKGENFNEDGYELFIEVMEMQD